MLNLYSNLVCFFRHDQRALHFFFLRNVSEMSLFFLIKSSAFLFFFTLPSALSSFHSPSWSWCSGWRWWSQAMASFRAREVWSSWTTAPAWTGCSCGVVCSGTATFAWRRSASRLPWRVFLALVSLQNLAFFHEVCNFVRLLETLFFWHDTKLYHSSCVFQAGQCRWRALSLLSAVGLRTRSTWRTCWITSVTSESPCSFFCSPRAQTSQVRPKGETLGICSKGKLLLVGCHRWRSCFTKTRFNSVIAIQTSG